MQQAIKRIKDKTGNFTIVANEIFKRSDVSARAKGIYIYIMTLPDDWKIYKSELYRHFTEGKASIDTAFSELERLGYIKKERIKDEKGKFSGWNFQVFESPTYQNTDIGKTESRENRKSGNQTLLSTDSSLSTDSIERTKKNTMCGEQEKPDYTSVINHLNEQSGKNYRTTDTTKRLIHARLAEGFTFNDFFTVIDKKCKQWKGTDMDKYLRPSTLFAPSKFEGYLNEKVIEKRHAGSREAYPVDMSKYDSL